MIRTAPFLRITLQLRHIFLTDARTFIIVSIIFFKVYLTVPALLRPLKLAFFIKPSYWLPII